MATTEPIETRERLLSIYRLYRTSLLSKKYYGHKLVILGRVNRILEVVIAVGTSGSIGATVLWTSSIGSHFWQWVAGTATTLAVAHPFLTLGDQINRYSSLFTGYSAISYDLGLICDEIKETCQLTDDAWVRHLLALERTRLLSAQEDPHPSARLRRRYYDDVNQEVPPDSFWLPPQQALTSPAVTT